MNETKKAIAIIVGITVFISIGMWIMSSTSNQSEIVECNQWQSQAQQYSGFYLTSWQAEQCASHNITINAPVK